MKIKKKRIQGVALSITKWVGSPQSIAVHSVFFFLGFLSVFLKILPTDTLLLIFNTIVSLEAIYLALFIQMTVNYTSESLQDVEQGIGEIQEDIDEIQEDVDEIQEDIDEIQEDVDEMQEEERPDFVRPITLNEIKMDLEKLLKNIENLEKK